MVDERVEARLRRQRLLKKESKPRHRALLDEAVLRRQVGGSIMHAHLDKIFKCAAQDQVTVHVVPFNVGAHASTDSNFTLLEFDEISPQRSVVFVEGLTSNLYQECPAEIKRYREPLDYLRDAALSPRDSSSPIIEISIDKLTGLSPTGGGASAAGLDYHLDRRYCHRRSCRSARYLATTTDQASNHHNHC